MFSVKENVMGNVAYDNIRHMMNTLHDREFRRSEITELLLLSIDWKMHSDVSAPKFHDYIVLEK